MSPIRRRWALTVAAFAARAIAGLTPRTSLAASPGKPARPAVATLALAFLFSLAASEAHADIAFVQDIGTATANSTGTTTTVSVPAAGVAAGDSIILTFTCGDVAGDFSATDSAGNTYTVDVQGTKGAGSFTLNPEYEIVAATNAYHATGTLSPARNWVANVATYTADPNCGNGIVDAGEDCDLGATNGIAGSCCSTSCRFRPSTRLCRAAFGECDLAVNCTGTSATCPEDASKKAAGTACTADTNPCTLDVCDGSSSTCTHPAGNQGTVCRAAAGPCDAAETCDGTSTTCPPDAVQPAGTDCTADTNPCTLEVCDGTSTACQHPAGNPGAVCRAAAGPCDVAETCTGTSTTGSTNLFLSSSTERRASAA